MPSMDMNFLSEGNPSMDPPPPYTPRSTSPTSPDQDRSPQPQPEQEPDTKHPPQTPSTTSETTSTSALSQTHRSGIQIPSRRDYFTSGFAYPPFLADYAITPAHWTQFTDDLNEEVKLSPRQWATTVAKGVGVGVLGGMAAGVLGAIPAVFVARLARRNREEMNLAIASAPTQPDTDSASGSQGQGRLSRKIERWNEMFFRPRGIVVRVVLPREDLDEMQGMEVMEVGRFGFSSRDEGGVREDAARKARIVIIPVDTDSASVHS